ncbi:unnamed protein product [Protopolystoma xenopodis]|uniref:Uncharacterized protein n=1 Tax=Protopolystoma xenopodis TaxID=117903 RepID=A0A448WBQ9_9PLAT|nr:unnamed protein product [Protopolystoma xenopodis]
MHVWPSAKSRCWDHIVENHKMRIHPGLYRRDLKSPAPAVTKFAKKPQLYHNYMYMYTPKYGMGVIGTRQQTVGNPA